MLALLSSFILGGAMGANDGGAVFGTAVASRMIRYRAAVTLAAVFILAGALLQGHHAIRTLGGLTEQTTRSAMIVSLVAGATVILMTWLKLPVSTSQAVIGVIIGMGVYTDPQKVQWASLIKILLCWVGTPVLAAFIAMMLYPALGRLIDRLGMNLITRSIVLRFALLTAGAYSAYSMGANCSGSITGVFYGTEITAGLAHPKLVLALMGGSSIAIGVIGFSRKVMYTVGRRLVQLGAFSAFIALLAEAITIHIYAMLGVPVSVTQALVGAVLGIGLVKGLRTIHRKTLWRILFGWLATPLIGASVCYLVALFIR